MVSAQGRGALHSLGHVFMVGVPRSHRGCLGGDTRGFNTNSFQGLSSEIPGAEIAPAKEAGATGVHSGLGGKGARTLGDV